MLVIGAILCGTDKKQLFKKDVLFFCFVRLILVAVITYVYVPAGVFAAMFIVVPLILI